MALQSFGIPAHLIPLSESGDIETADWVATLEKRRKEEAEKATSNLFPTQVQEEQTNLEQSRKEFDKQMETFDLDDLD